MPAPRAFCGGGGGRGGRGAGRGGRGRGGDTTAAPAPPPQPTGPRNCHDVTAYPALHLLAGACASYGLLVDISNPEKPVRLDARADTNFSLWHTAVFSNDGTKVMFTDEWGGGTSPKCQATSMMEMGGNTILTIGADKKYTQHAYFKIPTAQTAQENCVSHNGGLVPVPGRDIMVQGWYQGGIDVIDFTDPDHPYEIAYFDRGPVDHAAADAAVTPRAGAVGRFREHDRRLVGRVLLERHDLLVRARPRVRHPRADAHATALGERDRRGEAGEVEGVQSAEPAEASCGRRRSPWCARISISSCATTVSRRRAGRRSQARSTPRRSRAVRARGAALTKLATQVDADVRGAKDPARVKAMSAEIKRLAAVSK